MTFTYKKRSPYCVGGNRLEPIVVQVEQHHLRLRGLEDEVAELLHFEARLERQLQLRPLDHDVREVQQVDLGIQQNIVSVTTISH